jgi:hypothetical protein
VGDMVISRVMATCRALIGRVLRAGRPGKQAELASGPAEPDRDWIGSLAGKGVILGDLVEPAIDPDEWGTLCDRSADSTLPDR